MEDDCPASFSMLEVAHHSQYHFFEFPKLASKHTECSKDQLNAMDHLIDCMDLTLKSEDAETPRDTFEKDLLSFNKLPHIFERNFMDIMERKIICKASETDEQFQEMLKDKNFVEVFWKLPEPIEKSAKNAAKEVKKLFPLEVSEIWLKKLQAREKKKANQTENNEKEEESTNNNVQLAFDHVRSSSPAEDFEQLLKAYVFPIKDSTQRDVKFNHYANQLCTIVKELIFKSDGEDFEKIAAALTVYRKRCFIFNAFDDYNKWISSIKSQVVNKRMSMFWDKVIVKHELGLCFIGEPSLDEQIKEKDFYSLEFCDDAEPIKLTPEQMEMNDSEMDEMLANIDDGN